MNKKALIIFVSITIVVIIITALDIYSRILKIYYPRTYENEVIKYASKYEIDENWIFALIKAESNFKENSISSSGAVGLMQLMEKTAKETAEEIRHGIWRFKRCKRKYRTRHKILYKTIKVLRAETII